MTDHESKIINPANYPANKADAKQNLNKKLSSNDSAKKPEKPEKVVEKVVSGTVTRRKKSLGKKMGEVFTGDDARSVGNYLLFEVLLPSTKSLIFDLITGGAERSLFGTSGGRRPRGTGPRKVSYDRMYSGGTRSDLDRPGGVRNMSKQSRANHDFDDIVFDDRGEADEVLERLQDLINDYEAATVADFYDLSGVGSELPDERWGWTNLAGSSISSIRGGFVINLPRTEPLN